MSEGSNLGTVRKVYEHWGNGDFASGVEPYGPDTELVLGADFPDAGAHRGLDAIRSYTRGFLSPWDSISIAADELQDFGDRVLVRVFQRGIGTSSGIEIEMRYFQLWTFEGSTASRVEAIMDEADALEAAQGEPS